MLAPFTSTARPVNKRRFRPNDEGLIELIANKGAGRVTIVGTGLVCASWVATFLAHGFDVVATDPAATAERELRRYIAIAWPTLKKSGLAQGASPERLNFQSNLGQAIAGADVVLWCRNTTPYHENLEMRAVRVRR
jgi:UDP-glucose 6-dehydrogenase